MHHPDKPRRTSCWHALLAAALLMSAAGFAEAEEAEKAEESVEAAPAPPRQTAPQPVLEGELGAGRDGDYARVVEELFARFEALSGRQLIPGAKGKVGLKIYCDSGPGLATPIPLTKAVITALERRGFKGENIFLVGLNALRLRLTSYLPSPASSESPFREHPIYVLESGKFYDPTWFYDSPLPTRFDPVLNERAVMEAAAGKAQTTLEEDRKSFLATPLFLDADFWINLPVYTDHPTLGVNGALVNATLWNASNTLRFFRSPANAPAAVAEMAAIPELRETWVFTLVSLERYQFIGGPYFNSLYTRSEPLLWLSADPVMLDALMVERLNRARRETGFQPIGQSDLRMLEFAQQLGVGRWRTDQVRRVRVE